MYIVIEIQTNADGTVGSLVYSYAERNEAEAQFHRILAAAAVSALPKHAAAMMSAEGFPLLRGCYLHGGAGEDAPVFPDGGDVD